MAFAARRDEVFELAGDLKAIRIQAVFAGAVIEDAGEIDAQAAVFSDGRDAACDLAGAEHGDALIEAAARLQGAR